MNYTLKQLQDKLNRMIEDQGYAYATGYSRSAMNDVANDLSAILKQMREEEDS